MADIFDTAATLDEMERECIARIKALQREYELSAQPWAEQLARIRNCRAPVIHFPIAPFLFPLSTTKEKPKC